MGRRTWCATGLMLLHKASDDTIKGFLRVHCIAVTHVCWVYTEACKHCERPLGTERIACTLSCRAPEYKVQEGR